MVIFAKRLFSCDSLIFIMKNANWKNDIHKAKIQKMNLLKSRAHLVLAIFKLAIIYIGTVIAS